ncbi:MAG: TlpA family protein disulfide reductase [Flavobacteriaceae bacterium]|nr:TlpA family protein disulfide reductase [Flavobacteriaceae bacterium]
MNKKITILGLICFLLAISCAKKENKNSIIKNYEDKIRSAKSIEYDVDVKNKRLSSDKDTLKLYSNARLIRDDKDTIFGGLFWVKTDSIERYYDTKHIYIINHNNKAITRYFPHKGQDWVIKKNPISSVLDSYFFKTNILSKYLKDSIKNIITFKDSILDNTKLSLIEVKFPNESPIENPKKVFYFKKNNRLKKITFSVSFQKNTQYKEWDFSNKKYNIANRELFEKNFERILKNYSIKDYIEKEVKFKSLTIGNKAPNFKGIRFRTNESIELKSLKNKIVIIDFWHKDCYPCVKAIPFLSKLRNKYSKAKLEILGVNSINDREKDKNRITKFIKINKMNYPAIFVDKKVQEEYKINAFPTLYILDKKGKVIFSKVGYDKVGENKIDSILNKIIL